ncbi:MAG TPA: hypothetical protein VJO52_09645 [Gemmatimonadaceae bacterium]|nr:hypothetical protein [Gemmatimonadaceae bacterium]
MRCTLFNYRQHLAARGDGWFWGASIIGAAPALFDTSGLRYVSLSLPPTLGATPYSRGDARLAFTHDTLVVAYMWAGHFLIVAGTPPSVRDLPALESLPIPSFHQQSVTVGGQVLQAYRADSTDPPATLSLAVSGGLIYALY